VQGLVTPPANQRAAGIGLAALAVCFFSSSATFVRLAAPISPYEITFWRMLFATATVLAGLAASGSWKADPFPWERRYVLFGLVAALHFLLFVTSLSFTTIAHSLAITYLAPVFTALAAWRSLGERLRLRQALGTGVAIAGIAILVGFEPRLTNRMLLGDGLALLSAVCYAAYSIAGRSERQRYGLLAYATAVYGMAAVWLIPALAAGLLGVGRPAGLAGLQAYSWPRMLALFGSGVLPLGVGHTLYNASLRRIPAAYANLIASQEVTGGVVLGALVLGEIPSLTAVSGAAIALAGIVLVLL
ncbi:MAG TPA: DMT family transporter, partial [Chloroflexota bacterium]|nr:DMT family transporter [Chloroflexota bacterium]